MAELTNKETQLNALLEAKDYSAAVALIQAGIDNISTHALFLALDHTRHDETSANFEAIIAAPGVAEKFGATREGQSSLI